MCSPIYAVLCHRKFSLSYRSFVQRAAVSGALLAPVAITSRRVHQDAMAWLERPSSTRAPRALARAHAHKDISVLQEARLLAAPPALLDRTALAGIRRCARVPRVTIASVE
jgi:hypothetical protein